MGMTHRQLLWRVELPLAVPEIIAGLRIATVSTVAIATLAVFAGAGGLGAEIYAEPHLQDRDRHLRRDRDRDGDRLRRPAGRRAAPDLALAEGEAGMIAAGSSLALPLASVLDSFSGAIEFIFSQRESELGRRGTQVGGLDQVWELTWSHIEVSALALAVSLVLALPIGVLLGHRGKGELLAVAIGNAGRAIPELALIAFMVAFIGVGLLNVTIALVVLGIPPILTNTFVGIRQVDRGAVEAARGMGMTRVEVVRKVELPLAVPTIMTGVRTAAINIVATATIAPLAGVLTLGDFILTRNVYGDEGVLAGAILVALLALAVELALAGVQRLLTPAGPRAAARGARAHRIPATPRGGECPAERREEPSMSTKIRLRALFALLAVAVLSRRHRRLRRRRRDDGAAADGRGLIEANPDNNGVADHGRLEELHRAVHPRRDLRPGARGRGLRRQHRPQPGRRDGRAEGAEGRRDRRLSRVHLDRPDLVLRHQPGGRPGGRPAGVRGVAGGLRERGPGRLPADPVQQRQRGRHC